MPAPFPEPPLGILSFENVGFTYVTRDAEPVLRGVSFAVRAGEKVALVGPSGAVARSTDIFALAQRFYELRPSVDAVRVDGLDVRDVDKSALRRHFAYVEQEPTIFAGTIADNIRFGKPEASLAEVKKAAEAALVDDYVSELDRGYEALVGERGIMLSGGQKQRLAIARALLKNAPILLLDEATSALDAQSERLVQIALERLMKGRTIAGDRASPRDDPRRRPDSGDRPRPAHRRGNPRPTRQEGRAVRRTRRSCSSATKPQPPPPVNATRGRVKRLGLRDGASHVDEALQGVLGKEIGAKGDC